MRRGWFRGLCGHRRLHAGDGRGMSQQRGDEVGEAKLRVRLSVRSVAGPSSAGDRRKQAESYSRSRTNFVRS